MLKNKKNPGIIPSILYRLLRASVCWTFRTHDLRF